jgi:hypothetical protein
VSARLREAPVQRLPETAEADRPLGVYGCPVAHCASVRRRNGDRDCDVSGGLMTFDEFIETAWNDHGDRPREVADRLASSLGVVTTPADITPFARLVAHVYGEHLGEWHGGISLLKSLRNLPAWNGSPAVAGAVDRSIAVLRYAGGDGAALDPLSRDDRVAVLAMAGSAFAGRSDFKRALSSLTAAIRSADEGLGAHSAAIRSLAVGGNNVAAALEEKPDRDAAETAGMVMAAECGLKYWKLAGTWLEEERAEYRLARSLLQAGQAGAAAQSARRCIDVCAGNDAPPIELFFGHVVLAVAQRETGDRAAFEASRKTALGLYERIGAEERPWCESELAELEGRRT